MGTGNDPISTSASITPLRGRVVLCLLVAAVCLFIAACERDEREELRLFRNKAENLLRENSILEQRNKQLIRQVEELRAERDRILANQGLTSPPAPRPTPRAPDDPQYAPEPSRAYTRPMPSYSPAPRAGASTPQPTPSQTPETKKKKRRSGGSILAPRF